MDATQLIRERRHMSWEVVFVGLCRHWVDRQVVDELAFEHLDRGSDNYLVAAIAGDSAADDRELREMIAAIIRSEGRSVPDPWNVADGAVKVWRWAFVMCAIEEVNDELLLDRLEELYAEFGFPEDMESFSRYSSSSDGGPLVAAKKLIEKLCNEIAQDV